MAIVFKSSERRLFWSAIAFSLGCEYAVASAYFLFATHGDAASWVWALAVVIGLQIFMAAYGLFSFLRRAIWYNLVEKDRRAEALAQEFERLSFPRGDGLYADAESYLAEVALSPATSPEGAMFAGKLLGAMESHKMFGPRSEAFFLSLSIERAIKKMLPWERAAEWHSLSGK